MSPEMETLPSEGESQAYRPITTLVYYSANEKKRKFKVGLSPIRLCNRIKSSLAVPRVSHNENSFWKKGEDCFLDRPLHLFFQVFSLYSLIITSLKADCSDAKTSEMTSTKNLYDFLESFGTLVLTTELICT